MPTEPYIPPYIYVQAASSSRFTGNIQDIRRCALAVLLGTIGHLNGGVHVEAAATSVTFDGKHWEGKEVFGDFLLLNHQAEYMLVRPDGAADQHCQRIVFAARYNDTLNDGDNSEDELCRHQRAAALERLVAADL